MAVSAGAGNSRAHHCRKNWGTKKSGGRYSPARQRRISAMSDEDKAKVEKEFLEQSARDKELVEQTATAGRMVRAVMEELHQKHEGDEEKMRREFMQLCKEDAALKEAVFRLTFEDLRRAIRPFEKQ
jgi:hypothetical protein